MADPWESDATAPWANDAPASPAADPNAYVPGRVAGYQIPGLATLDNMTRVAQDAMTFGGADAATGGTARADTQKARDSLGWASPIADLAGYAAGPGELGAGAGLAKLLGGRMLARVAGSAAEGAGASALGTFGHGDTDLGDIGKSAGVGALVGGATGALPVARKAPDTPSTADLMNDAHDAWKKTYAVPVNPADVGNALTQAHLNLTPGERVLMDGGTQSAINRAMRESQGQNSLSGNDVKKFQDAIMGSTRDPQALKVAGKFKDALDTAYGPQAQPLVQAANRATSISKTSGELDDLLANPKGAPAAVVNMLKNDPGLYARIRPALQPVGALANPTLGRDIMHRLAAAGIGAGGGAALSALTGGNSYGEMLAGAALGALKGRGVAAVKNKPITNALLAAQHMNATGLKLPPSAFSQSSPYATIPSDLLRQAGYAAGAAGSY